MNRPLRIGESRGDLVQNGGFIIHHEHMQGIVIPLGLGLHFRAGLQIDDAPDALHNQILLERLDQVVTHPQLGDPQHIFPARLGGQHHNRYGAGLRIRLELGEHLHPVHDRHCEIQNDDVRLFTFYNSQPLNPIRCFQNLAGKGAERPGNDHPDGLAIVNS